MQRSGQGESRAERGARGRALAGFFAAGATVSLAVILLPGWEGIHRWGIAVTVVAAAAASLVLLVYGKRFPRGAIHLTTASGTALIAACQVLAGGGSPTAMYAMLYIWVPLHCALFFSRSAVAGHIALATAAHALALVWLGDVASMAPQLALTLGTQVAAALVVGSLATGQRHLADTDPLTGLHNRRAVERSLEWSLARTRRAPGIPTCVALLDLDEFKAFNDRFGHLAGDRALVEVASAWSGLIRETDALARAGGDEFTLVLHGCSIEEAERILRRMATTVPDDLACSVGVARWDGRETADELLERADGALYRAKADPDARVVVAPGPSSRVGA